MENQYPLTFSVDYPDRELNRLTTFFRFFTVIPIAIVLATVSGGTYSSGTGDSSTYIAAAGGFLFLAVNGAGGWSLDARRARG